MGFVGVDKQTNKSISHRPASEIEQFMGSSKLELNKFSGSDKTTAFFISFAVHQHDYSSISRKITTLKEASVGRQQFGLLHMVTSGSLDWIFIGSFQCHDTAVLGCDRISNPLHQEYSSTTSSQQCTTIISLSRKATVWFIPHGHFGIFNLITHRHSKYS